MNKSEIKKKLYKHIKKGKAKECWPWTGALHDSGLPVMRMGSKNKLAQRVMYETSAGAIEEEHVITTSCGNRICMNSSHLVSVPENDLHPRGERHPQAKVTTADVRKIREQAEQGKTYKELSKIYNVSDQTISNIAHRRTWGHIE